MRKKLLIESAEFISKVKVSKELKESLEMSAGKSGTLIIKNIPCTLLDRENQNGRIYSTEVLQEALKKAKPLFEQKQLLSQADEHPESSFVAPTHASHVVINAYIKPNVLLEVDGERETDNVLFMDWEILNTEEGKNLRALFEAECSIGTSIRGLGDMRGNMVENYDLLGCDCVGNPSSSTYTRMPISESIQVEFKKDNELKETFTVSSSSTTTTRDLDQAEQLIRNVDEISFGTVTKTQTKFDRENDPKTGAETTITHVEIETSDDESALDAALQRAKNALLNPVVSIDSVTIENVKDEDKKEASTYQPETPLKEEEPSEQEANVEYIPDEEGEMPAVPADYVPSLEDADREYISDLNDEDIQTFIDNWNNYNAGEKETLVNFVFRNHKPFEENTQLTEAKKEDKEEEEKPARTYVLKAPAGFVGMNGNAITFEQQPKDAIHFLEGKEESGVIHLSGIQKILDTMGVYEVEKYYRVAKNDLNNLATSGDANNVEIKEPAKEGLLSPDINITTGDIASGNDVNVSALPESTLKEENGSNTKYSAKVSINNSNGSKVEDIPVSATEMDAVISEIGNLYDMKSQKEEGVSVSVTDTQSGQQFMFNPETRALDPIDGNDIPTQEIKQEPVSSDLLPAQESTDAELKQDNNKLEIDVDDNTHIEKEFENPIQASVAKAGIEKGKIGADVMLSEDEVSEKLYSEPTAPSDPLETKQEPLQDASDYTITLSSIDYDIDNLQDDDLEGDLHEFVSLVDQLPNTVEVKLDKSLENDPNLLDIILQKAKEQTGLPIRNATVIDVQ